MSLPIVLLHGANSAAEEVAPLAQALREQGRTVAVPNLYGHGGRPVPDELSIPALAADLCAQLDGNGIARAVLAGYSVGGLVALYCARHYPGRVAAVVTLATRVMFDDATVAFWVDLATEGQLVLRAPNRRFQLAHLHQPQDWRAVLARNRAMFASLRERPPLSAADLAAIQVPVLLVSGSRDPLVSREETHELGRQLRGGVLVFEGAAHPLMAVPLEPVAHAVAGWLRSTLPGGD